MTNKSQEFGSREVIRANDVYKTYDLGQIKVNALKGASFTIHDGEFVSLVGPSGSGKSTIFNIIGTLDTPTKGTVFVNGKDVATMSEAEKTRFRSEQIGFVFQFYNLVPVLTAVENVMLPMAAMQKPVVDQKIAALKSLKMVGLEGRVDHRPDELSGGEQQRVCIARALINSPAIILADEPTGNLDQETGNSIMSLFKRLNEENHQSFLIITHDPAVAAKTLRTLFIEDGIIVQDSKPDAASIDTSATSIIDRAVMSIKKSMESGGKASIVDLARELNVQVDRAEQFVERILRGNMIKGHIEGDYLIEKKTTPRGVSLHV
jgi:ABC-type lipoprotein export system ATPase subunit